jgi:hypothetical protein
MIRALLFLFCTSVALQAENWPNWRGPAHNHSSPETGLPEKFSKTENVKWSVTLPGPAAATPIIWGDRVFLPAADAASGKQVAMCLDRKTGKELWRAPVRDFTTDGQ